jgi:hypothetical protein
MRLIALLLVAVAGGGCGPARASTLEYRDPPAGGRLRLVGHPGSPGSQVVLDLVVAVAVTAYSAGFDLPVDVSRVELAASPLVIGSALDPGAPPRAAAVALPSDGPLAGTLVSAVSQKAAGAGAVVQDVALVPGAWLYSLVLVLAPGATPGTVFDGAKLDERFDGGIRDRDGNDQVGPAGLAIGVLTAR